MRAREWTIEMQKWCENDVGLEFQERLIDLAIGLSRENPEQAAGVLRVVAMLRTFERRNERDRIEDGGSLPRT